MANPENTRSIRRFGLTPSPTKWVPPDFARWAALWAYFLIQSFASLVWLTLCLSSANGTMLDHSRIHRLPALGIGDEGCASEGELAAGFRTRDHLNCLEQRILFGVRSSECHEVRQEAS